MEHKKFTWNENVNNVRERKLIIGRQDLRLAHDWSGFILIIVYGQNKL